MGKGCCSFAPAAHHRPNGASRANWVTPKPLEPPSDRRRAGAPGVRHTGRPGVVAIGRIPLPDARGGSMREIVTRARRALAGLSIALLVLALIEFGARALERRLSPPEPFGFATVRNALVADGHTGEPTPSFFVPTTEGLEVRSTYTDGARCYPFHCQSIPASKPSSEFRIACFGESTTAGLDLLPLPALHGVDLRKGPWPGPEPFCLRVGRALQKRMPDRLVTAYNLGGDACDSEKLLPVMREVARRLRFDLWVVYMGHNEFIYASGLVERRRPPSLVARVANLAASNLALYRHMTRLWRHALADARFTRVREYAREPYVRTSDNARVVHRITATYQARLREIVALAHKNGARLVFSEVVSNHLWGGSADEVFTCYGHGAAEDAVARIQHECQRAGELQRAGAWEDALAAYLRAEAADPGYQPALLGAVQCRLALGHREEALATSYRAQALAALPTLVTPEMTEMLRQVARETNTPLASCVESFDHIFLDDPLRYARLFLDDCHPNAEGHGIIADAIVAALDQANAFPSSGPEPGPALRPEARR
jgi:hypothetical protein